MSGIMPPPIFQKPVSWDDCHCQCAQDRFYETYGNETFLAVLKRWRSLGRFLAGWRLPTESKKPAGKPALDCR